MREAPLQPEAGIAVLRGNLAPLGAVIKPAAATPALLQHRGRAVVFESVEDLHARIDDPDLDVDADSVLVLRGCGPKGYPGMPEVSNMPLPTKLLEQGVRDMVRVCDGRMSGTAFGTVVLHVAPEAAAGGVLALVRDGDIIELDVAGRRLVLDVPDDELAARVPSPAAAAAYAAPTRGWERLYIDHVQQADTGADLDFLLGVDRLGRRPRVPLRSPMNPVTSSPGPPPTCEACGRADQPAFGLWSVLPDPTRRRAAGRRRRWTTCASTSSTGSRRSASCPRCCERCGAAGVAPIVRVPWNEPAAVMRALDTGASAVLVPMVNSAAEAARAAAACRFPPTGERSWGPMFGDTRPDGALPPAEQDAAVLCLVMVETLAGVEALEEIVRVPGRRRRLHRTQRPGTGVRVRARDLPRLGAGGRPDPADRRRVPRGRDRRRPALLRPGDGRALGGAGRTSADRRSGHVADAGGRGGAVAGRGRRRAHGRFDGVGGRWQGGALGGAAPSDHGAHAAVDEDVLTRDERRGVAREVHHGPDELLDPAPALGRRALTQPGVEGRVGRQRLVQWA